ncbi:RidA family protein [Salibacterium aidingense]|uniref:RidA family protein n=1 Tax=Salibacterium aidingense TaxID=384933 RepID=UPI003BCE4D07
MSNYETKLEEMGYSLPIAAKPSFDYVPVVVHHDIAYVSGQLPKVEGEVKVKGEVPAVVSIEEAKEAAITCILQGLACIKQHTGSLDAIEKIIKITGYVQSSEGFDAQPRVIDAASALLGSVFGEKGRHARAAIGVNALPRSTPVEIEMIAAINKEGDFYGK